MDTNDYTSSAVKHYGAGEYDAAIADMNKAIELSPNDANNFALRGDIYSGKHDYDRALDDYGRSIQISPNVSAYYGIGLVYANKGEWEKAIQEYTKSIQLNPENSHVHLNYYNRGWAYYKCNRIEDALVDIEKAVQIVPDDEDYLRGLEVVKNSSNGDVDIAFIQHEIKILLICSGICAAIGIVIGVISCGGSYGDGKLGGNILAGIWIGAGIGAILEYIRAIPAVFASAVKEEGFGAGLKSTLIGLLVWLAIFIIGGPIGMLVKILKRKYEINKIKKGAKNR